MQKGNKGLVKTTSTLISRSFSSIITTTKHWHLHGKNYDAFFPITYSMEDRNRILVLVSSLQNLTINNCRQAQFDSNIHPQLLIDPVADALKWLFSSCNDNGDIVSRDY